MDYNKDLFKAYIINNDEIELCIEKTDFTDTLVIPDYCDNKPVTLLSGLRSSYSCLDIKTLILGKNIKNVNTNCDMTRRSKYALEKIFIPCSLTKIERFFLGSLTPKLKTFLIEENHPRFEVIDNCLVDKISKTLLLFLGNPYIPDTEEIENISEFALCKMSGTTKANIYIPKNIKCISRDMFRYAKGCYTYTVSTENERYTSKDGYLYDKKTKTILRFNEDLETIDLEEADIEHIGTKAFERLTKLESINLPKKLKSISLGAFAGCRKLLKIDIPDSVIALQPDAFMHCVKLKNIKLPRNLSCSENYFLNINRTIKKIDYNNIALDYAFIMVGKANKLPIVVGNTITYNIIDDRKRTLIIPECVNEVRILAQEEKTLDKVIVKGMVTKFIVENVVIKDMEFTNKACDYQFKDGVVYSTSYDEGVYYFIGNDVETYTFPDFVKNVTFNYYGGKNLKKVVVPKTIKRFIFDKIYDRDEVPPVIEILNPSIDFDCRAYYAENQRLIIDSKTTKKFIEVNGNYFRKKDKLFVGRKTIEKNIWPKDAKDFANYVKAYKKGELDGLKDSIYIGVYDPDRNFSIACNFHNGQIYIDKALNDEMCVENNVLNFKKDKVLYIKVPCKIDAEPDSIIQDIMIQNDEQHEVMIPKTIKGFGKDFLENITKHDNVDLKIDSENPYYEIVDGVIIDKKKNEAIAIVGKYLNHEEIHIKEGVKKLNLNLTCKKSNTTIYIPRSVNKINCCKYFYNVNYKIDKNNKTYYEKNGFVYNRSKDLPLTF